MRACGVRVRFFFSNSLFIFSASPAFSTIVARDHCPTHLDRRSRVFTRFRACRGFSASRFHTTTATTAYDALSPPVAQSAARNRSSRTHRCCRATREYTVLFALLFYIFRCSNRTGTRRKQRGVRSPRRFSGIRGFPGNPVIIFISDFPPLFRRRIALSTFRITCRRDTASTSRGIGSETHVGHSPFSRIIIYRSRSIRFNDSITILFGTSPSRKIKCRDPLPTSRMRLV